MQEKDLIRKTTRKIIQQLRFALRDEDVDPIGTILRKFAMKVVELSVPQSAKVLCDLDKAFDMCRVETLDNARFILAIEEPKE